jgi:oxygen-dependent protoporphyrinogen oxidase
VSRVAVVGGGITGLAAAFALAGRIEGADVVVLEAGPRLGGRIRTEPVAGRPLDLGPDGFLARVPDAAELSRELGLGAELVASGTSRALLFLGGRLRPIPPGTLFGVPSSLRALARSGVLSPTGLGRAALDLVLPRRDRAFGQRGGQWPGADAPDAAGHAGPDRAGPADVTVEELVGRRLGREVLERLVDPVLGGIHAGPAGPLSVAANAPALLEAARRSPSLIRGVRAVLAPLERAAPSPMFLTLRSGLESLVDRLAWHLRGTGVELRTSSPVSGLVRDGPGFRLLVPDGELAADGAVLAVPAPQASSLLSREAPDAAAELAALRHGSVSLASIVLARGALRRFPHASGFLVPRSEGRLLTACTFASTKWPHLAEPGRVVLRASSGRAGDDRHLGLDDAALVEALLAELDEALGIDREPEAVALARFVDAFPQYEQGHLERVARLEAAVRRLGPLALAGAAYRGVGIPSCIAQGRRAAEEVLGALEARAAR